jgi:hypothetical protein
VTTGCLGCLGASGVTLRTYDAGTTAILAGADRFEGSSPGAVSSSGSTGLPLLANGVTVDHLMAGVRSLHGTDSSEPG